MTIVYCSWTTGDDTSGTGTAASPYKTITKASTSRAAGDEVRVAKSPDPTSLTGTTAWTLNGTTVTGTGTLFTTELAIGDFISAPDGGWYEVITIVSNTTATLYKKYPSATASGHSSQKLGVTDTGAAGASTTQVQIVNSSGNSTSTLIISGGWDLATETQTGQTWFRQLNATDTGTLGRLLVAVHKIGALPVWQEFMVVTANVYDTLCSTDAFNVNVATIADDAITAAALKADAVTEIQNGLATAAAMATAQADLDNPDQYKADVSGIPAAVWGYATRTLSSFGTLVSDIWGHVTRTLTAFGFMVATNSDANVTAIKAKTDGLPISPAPSGEYDAELAAIQADLDNPAQYKADVSGLATASALSALDGKVDAIDTDSLMQTIIDGYTFKQVIEIMAAVLAGKLTRTNNTLTFRDLADTVDRVVSETDVNKQRIGMTYME